jgi:hypothetical protein
MRRLRRVIQAVIVDYEGICNFKKQPRCCKERDAVPDSHAEDGKREKLLPPLLCVIYSSPCSLCKYLNLFAAQRRRGSLGCWV